MTDALWTEGRVEERLENDVERRISFDDAYIALWEIVQEYEADRTASAATIDAQGSTIEEQGAIIQDDIAAIATLNGTVASVTAQVGSLTAQVGTLTQSNIDKATEIAGDNAIIANLQLRVIDLSPDVTVTIGSNVIATSRFETGMTDANNKDLMYANATAKTTGIATLKTAMSIYQKHLIGWGSGDVWPWDGTGLRPPVPTGWTQLDAYLNMGLAMGTRLALNTALYPWHLRGKWMPDGTTVPLTYAEQFSDTGVLMTNQVPAYLSMIKLMAERYLIPPYNVAIWTTGTEFHGLYQGRQRTYHSWRYDDFPGTPGANADMGAAYIHNITVDQILAVVAAKGIDPSKLVFINNYPPFIGRGIPTNDSVPVGHPLRGRKWGSANKQGPEILVKMPPLLKRVDAIGFDMSTPNMDGNQLVDDFGNIDKVDDYVAFIRFANPGKPVIVMEQYDKPAADPGANSKNYRAAIRAEFYRRLVLNGVWSSWVWGTQGEAMGTVGQGAVMIPDAALLTDTALATGGQATTMLKVIKLFHDHFGPGTPIYDVEVVGGGASVLVSDKVAVLISKTASPLKVALGGDMYVLDAHEVRAVMRG